MRNRTAQPRNSLRCRVTVGIRPLRDLDQLRHDVRRSRASGFPMLKSMMSSPRRELLIELSSDVENVGRQTLDARKTALAVSSHRIFLYYVSARNRPSDVTCNSASCRDGSEKITI